MEPILLTPSEVSDCLRVSKSRVYAWVKAGVLPSCLLGKSRRIPRQELLDWVEQQRGTSGGAAKGTRETDGGEEPR
jgi:excisionase family DNA binding protein